MMKGCNSFMIEESLMAFSKVIRKIKEMRIGRYTKRG